MKTINNGKVNGRNKWILHPETKEEVEFIYQLTLILDRKNTGSITLGSENPIDDKLEVFTE